MSDDLKSAWELALEKLEAQDGAPVAKLNEEQKQAIGLVRKKYQALIAEAEISAEAHVRKAIQSGSYDGIERIQQTLIEERARLNAQMESEIQKVRESGGS